MVAAAMTAALGLPAGHAAAASAPPWGALSRSIHVSPAKGSPGSSVTVVGSGFVCANNVDIFWQYTKGDPLVTEHMGSTFVTRGGGFSMELRVPEATRGESTVLATGSSDRSCRSSVAFRICFCDIEGYRSQGWPVVAPSALTR